MRILASSLAILASLSCGGKSPQAPDGPDGPSSPQSCRTYATSAAVSTSSPAGAITGTMTCSFDETTARLTCMTVRAGGGCTSQRRTEVTGFRSVADFIAGGQRIGTGHLTSVEVQETSICSGFTSSSSAVTAFTYDSAGRLTRNATSASPGGASTLDYTQWDSFSRWTAARSAQGTFTMAYDDAQRRTVSVGTAFGSQTTSTATYDSSLNLIRFVVASGSVTTDASYSVSGTARLCR